ncbi:MAG: glycosyltransferase [Archaeoglobaceae archaeon]|nr:glycosyltransferase [Archaeoglobaceae archaeon]
MIIVKVNIVRPNAGWILDFIAERIYKANEELNTGVEIRLNTVPVNNADFNYYIDVYNCYRGKTKIKDVGWLNAFHEGFDPKRAMDLDFIVFQNKKYQKEMIKLGYPKERTKVLYPGIYLDQFKLKKIKIGIFQTGVHWHKGHDFMLKLPEIMDLKNFAFWFIGKGWDDVVDLYIRKGIEVYYDASGKYEKFNDYYDQIDYLLVPSIVEGGPICVQEALAKGIPIIGSKTGCVEDFDVEYLFEPGDLMGLAKILMNIEKTRLNRREKVKNLTWQSHVRELIKVFEGIK